MYRTNEFYMLDWTKPGSSYGLYYGTLQVSVARVDPRTLQLTWRAEVPWVWPSYAELSTRHGRPDAEVVAIASLRSMLTGNVKHQLRLGNGLEYHVSVIGPARPFLAYAEWSERVVLN